MTTRSDYALSFGRNFLLYAIMACAGIAAYVMWYLRGGGTIP